jgi:hypothetical protein
MILCGKVKEFVKETVHWFANIVLILGSYLPLYIALLIIQVAYLEMPSTKHYIPRSKRGRAMEVYNQNQVLEYQLGKSSGKLHLKWESCRRSRKRVMTVTKIARRIDNGRHRSVAFLAFTSVAMQANGGLQDHQTAFDTDSAPIGMN